MMTPTSPPPGYPYLGPDPVEGIVVVSAQAVPTAVHRAAGVHMASISGLFEAVFGTAFSALFSAGVVPTGAALALYTRITEGSEADVEVGFPLDRPLTESIDGEAFEVDGLRIVPSVLPAGQIAVTSYIGPYGGLGEAWGRLMGEVAAGGRAPGMPCWESYVAEPTSDADPATMRTDLYCLVTDPSDAA